MRPRHTKNKLKQKKLYRIWLRILSSTKHALPFVALSGLFILSHVSDLAAQSEDSAGSQLQSGQPPAPADVNSADIADDQPGPPPLIATDLVAQMIYQEDVINFTWQEMQLIAEANINSAQNQKPFQSRIKAIPEPGSSITETAEVEVESVAADAKADKAPSVQVVLVQPEEAESSTDSQAAIDTVVTEQTEEPENIADTTTAPEQAADPESRVTEPETTSGPTASTASLSPGSDSGQPQETVTTRPAEVPQTQLVKIDPELSPQPAPEAVVDDMTGDITALLASWSNDWSAQDVSAYLNYYDERFTPEKNRSFADWRSLRQQRLSKPAFIKISLAAIEIEQRSAKTATATFQQAYRSDRFEDKVVKAIDLALTDSGWKITREYSIKTL